jgi:LysR family glycine cleavage system transcriptional activator
VYCKAPEALHATPVAVSMQIRAHERYLRVPLFRRKGRSVTLTAEGELLLPGVRRGLGTLLRRASSAAADELGLH